MSVDRQGKGKFTDDSRVERPFKRPAEWSPAESKTGNSGSRQTGSDSRQDIRDVVDK